ncbi:MAG: TonB-dependent receptor plug domain-containing protein [Candidatus Kapabacteria bacterium]|nr:TonB-dependent receptor plug domain-containing protein [Candidatus Kapabacteria bacterium]
MHVLRTRMKYRFASIVGRFVLTIVTIVMAIALGSRTMLAQDVSKVDIRTLDDLSFDQLLDIDLLQVASKKPLSKKDVPGVVTLIKREEIQNSGARDLTDVLRMVPGMEFGGDVQGIVGLGSRGNWANEGKAFVMIDGLQINDFLFATVPIANRFPIDNIERIEIIRGPGSSFYGGFAELTVINIITRAPQDINGLTISGNGGQMASALGRWNGNLSFGKKFGEVAVGVSAFMGQANMSDRTYTGLDNISFPMAGNQTMSPLFVNATVKAGNFQARVLYDRYNTTMRNGIGTTLLQNFSTNFTSLIADARYDLKISDNVTLTPRVNYTRQQPWNLADSSAVDPASKFNFLVIDKTVERLFGSLQISADVSKNLFFTLGTEYYIDNGTASPLDPPSSLWNDTSGNASRAVQYNNFGVFLQTLLTTDIVNVNAGLRLDRHSAVPLAVVPWLGLTKTIGNFNVKALFGQNFRAPSIENIRLYPQIKPELTTALEIEFGYQLQYNMFVSANIFDISIKDAIIFGGGGYRNFERTQTRGVELEYFFKDSWGSINVNYSFYVANSDGLSDSVRALNPYRVWSFRTDANGKQESLFTNDNVLLGFAPHKVTVNSSLNLSSLVDGLSINPSFIFLSSRYAVSQVKILEGTQSVEETKPVALLNIFVNYKNAFQLQGLDIGVGVYDALDAKYDFIQPYNIGNAVLPGPSREIVAKLAYRLRF